MKKLFLLLILALIALVYSEDRCIECNNECYNSKLVGDALKKCYANCILTCMDD